jgi:hypothetical protein
MAAVLRGAAGVVSLALSLWAMLLIVSSRRDGVGLTRRQLRDARRASNAHGQARPQPRPRS